MRGETHTQRVWVSCPRLHSKPGMMACVWDPRSRNKRQEDSHEFKANLGYSRRPHLKKQNENCQVLNLIQFSVRQTVFNFLPL